MTPEVTLTPTSVTQRERELWSSARYVLLDYWSEITCKLEWKPVCDTRGKTHANMCEAYKAGALVDHHGQCSWNPCGR